MKVEAKTGNPLLPYVRNPTPLVYAILCEQLDTVLYIILHLHASYDVKVNGVCLVFIGTQFIMQLVSRIMRFC